MPSIVRALPLVIVIAIATPSVALAGMPSVNLSDVVKLRVQTMSFFLMGILLSAFFVRLLWNYLRRDFAWLPRLSYCKALGVVVLWGLLFVLVLTMISGARELMTPGAWEKQGATYRLVRDRDPTYLPEEKERRLKLDRLRESLWDFARVHENRFPETDAVPEIPAERWQASESPKLRFYYVAGQSMGKDASPLVYEPGIYGDRRLVLLCDGSIKAMALEDIVQALPSGKP